MRLLFVRHGESVANAAGIYQGWYDSPLSPLGQQQAVLVAQAIAARRDLRPVAVYASPLARAWDTGAAIGAALSLVPRPDPGLREIDVGAATGLTFAAVNERWPNLATQRRVLGLDHGWPEGESGRQFFARVGGTLAALIAVHRGVDSSSAATVIVAAHGGTIRFALAYLRGETTDWPRDHIDNCSISEAVLTEAGARLVWINSIAHLSAKGVSA